MDRVPTFGLVDPDHDQPAATGRLPDHLVRPPVGQVDLDAIWVGEDLLERSSTQKVYTMWRAASTSPRPAAADLDAWPPRSQPGGATGISGSAWCARRLLRVSGDLGSDHWIPIDRMARVALNEGRPDIAEAVFAAADQPGFKRDYLHERRWELFGDRLRSARHRLSVTDSSTGTASLSVGPRQWYSSIIQDGASVDRGTARSHDRAR